MSFGLSHPHSTYINWHCDASFQTNKEQVFSIIHIPLGQPDMWRRNTSLTILTKLIWPLLDQIWLGIDQSCLTVGRPHVHTVDRRDLTANYEVDRRLQGWLQLTVGPQFDHKHVLTSIDQQMFWPSSLVFDFDYWHKFLDKLLICKPCWKIIYPKKSCWVFS